MPSSPSNRGTKIKGACPWRVICEGNDSGGRRRSTDAPVDRSYTQTTSTLAGRPLLEHHILNLKSAGFDQLIINVILASRLPLFAATEVTGVFPSESLTRMNRWRRQVASLGTPVALV